MCESRSWVVVGSGSCLYAFHCRIVGVGDDVGACFGFLCWGLILDGTVYGVLGRLGSGRREMLVCVGCMGRCMVELGFVWGGRFAA